MHFNLIFSVFIIGLLSACAQNFEVVQDQPYTLSKDERVKIVERLYDSIGPTFGHLHSTKHDTEMLLWQLRSKAFNKYSPSLEQSKTDLKALGNYEEIIPFINEVIAWRNDLEMLDAETVQKVAEKIQLKLFSIPRNKFLQASPQELLSIYLPPLIDDLWELAGKLGSDKARTKYVQSLEFNVARNFLEDNNRKIRHAASHRSYYVISIMLLAHQNYMPAQLDLFHRF